VGRRQADGDEEEQGYCGGRVREGRGARG